MAKRKRSPNLTVRLDPTLDADLDTITSTGLDRSAAVRLAVAFLAFGYRDLWANGIYPKHTAPPRMRWTTPRHYTRQAPDLRVVRDKTPSITQRTTPSRPDEEAHRARVAHRYRSVI
ncbi:hypothetical protein HHL19_12880 [Streptomyces sp. R302]|uniref:hypothetical protein n=1 Tax=unclassified Streptomyces TaxID=2593676 RepID=UPI00145F5A6C|nr:MULTISPECIES: hypothetical protein [unclassified Streptomyces]NML50555.1 hypothetical protein [Streptomyces sp. R301]NML79546.1 hypothetical protein [Streptomyces sp. R302]